MFHSCFEGISQIWKKSLIAKWKFQKRIKISLKACSHEIFLVKIFQPNSSMRQSRSVSSWRRLTSQLKISPDPSNWSCLDVAIWLKWAAREFRNNSDNNEDSEDVNDFIQNFKLSGKELCQLKKEEFCGLAPANISDTLWNHFQELKQENNSKSKNSTKSSSSSSSSSVSSLKQTSSLSSSLSSSFPSLPSFQSCHQQTLPHHHNCSNYPSYQSYHHQSQLYPPQYPPLLQFSSPGKDHLNIQNKFWKYSIKNLSFGWYF